MADYTDNGLMQPGQERYVIQAFRGIDDHERIADGSWQEMLNLTAEEYPAAMARKTRKRAKYYTTWEIKRCMIEGHGTQDGLHLDMVLTLEPGITPPIAPFEVKVLGRTYTVDAIENASVGSQDAKALVIGDYSKAYDIAVALRRGRVDALYNGGTVMPMGLGEPVDAAVIDDMIVTAYERGQIAYGDKVKLTDATVRRIACMGRMVYTDKGALLNTGTDEMTETHQLVWYDGGSYTVQMVDAGGASITVAQTEPNPPSDGDYWYDSVRDGLYQWSDGQQKWIAIPTMYTKITLPDPALLTPPDNTDLSGLKTGDVVEATIERYKSTYVVHSVDNTNHAIILRGLLYPTPAPPLTVGVIIERKMPVLDYICEHDNRIWGCRYGENADGEFVNEIYACALGDPMNWFLYEGTVADSWTASVGAPGKWTGIRECGEYLVFFKEDRYYILSGSAPSNYRLTEFEADGVMDGCDRSIQNIGGSLYYKSVHGIKRLTPYGYPQDVSEALNTDRGTDAIAGTDGRRYYIQMAQGDENGLYVLDTETGYWTREDAPEHMYLMLRYMNEPTGMCATEGTEFAYAGYDADAAEAAEPMKGDYEDIPSYVAAHLAWDMHRMESIAFAGMSVIQQCLTYEVTTPAALKAKVDDLNENGYFLKYKYFWNIDYILLASAGRNKTPFGFLYDENSFDASALEGEWVEDAAAEWYGVTGLMGLGLPDEKRVRVIQLRIKTEAKTRMKVKVQTDESGKWTEVWSANTGRSGTHRIAYTPAARNDTFRFRLEGTGPMVLYSITYQLEQGGDMNVPEHTKT